MRARVARLAIPLVTFTTIAIALVVRGRRALTLVDFPLNDGGLFYTIIDDLRRAGYALPQTLSYNHAGIPFAYPPLAFYLAAGVRDALGLSTADVLRLLPVVLSTLVVVAYLPLARALSRNAIAAAIATFVVAVQPSAYTWQVMGGGLTRALALLFATLALVALHSFYTRGSRVALAATALFASLTLLSHIEFAWFLVFSGPLFLLFHARDRRAALRGSLVIGAAVFFLTAPWWIMVLTRYGVGPLIAAATTGSLSNGILDLLKFQRTDEPFFPLVAATAILGVVVCLLRRDYFAPAWLVAIGVLDQRSFNVLSALPIGLMAGIVATEVLMPLARDRRTLIAVAGLAALYATVSSGRANQELHRALKPDERVAMTWVRDHSPADARILAIAERFWAGDRVTEWLPALSDRTVVDVVQGYEWFPRERGFWKRLEAYDLAQQCGGRDAACVEAWANLYGSFDYVYLPKTIGGYWGDGTPIWCCTPLRASLRADPRYVVVYDGEGATIFKRAP